MPQTNVVIVGAGSTGLIAALGLARSGVSVTLLDAQGPQRSPAPHDVIYRWSILPILERLDILEALTGVGLSTSQWCYKVLATGEELVFDLGLLADEVAHPFNLHVTQDRFAAVVVAELGRYPNVHIEWDCTVDACRQDDSGVTVSAATPDGPKEFRGDWLVGADGAHSTVRRALGLGFGGITWDDRLVSLSVDFDFASLGYHPTTYQLDSRHGALVAKVDESRLWRYVYSESRMLPQEAIGKRIPTALAAVIPVGASAPVVDWSAYRVHERSADRLWSGRVLLAGDAAHVTTPAGGFGLADGVRDAAGVTTALGIAVDGRATRDAALERYAEESERFFRTVASPLSSDTMNVVFHRGDPGLLADEIEHLAEIVRSPVRQREFLLLSSELEAAPLV